MRLFGCLNPKIITNPYTGIKTQCRCGKCAACLNTRSSNWVMRLDLEAQCHRYVLFTTLTYDEFNVPQLIKLKFEDYHPYEKNNFAFISDNSELIDIKDISERFEKKDFDYIRKSDFLNVLDKKDFQLFIKRLRYYFDQCDKGALLRYYICGELGPRTYRPHGHLLLFFDSKKCAGEIQVLLRKAWSFGNIYDPHFVHGSASEYVASYCNGTSNLPKIYLHKSVRPFTLFSKSPAIGSLYPNVKEVREIFHRGDIKFTRFDQRTNQFVDEYFWRSFTTRLFPRCQRFDSLVHSDRVALYRLIEDFPSHLTSVEVAKRIEQEYVFNFVFDNVQYSSFMHRYFWCISHKSVKSLNLRCVSYSPNNVPDNLPFPVPDDYPKEHKANSLIVGRSEKYNFNSLVAFVRTISRVRHQAQIFGVSISDYVTKIENYYERLKKVKLQDDYLYQDEYFATHPKWHWIYFDLSFYKKITSTHYFLLPKSTLKTLGYLFDGFVPKKCVYLSKQDEDQHIKSLVVDIPDFHDLDEYQDYFIMHDVISHRLVKQKENNDYALAHKDKFGNIIHYQNLD